MFNQSTYYVKENNAIHQLMLVLANQNQFAYITTVTLSYLDHNANSESYLTLHTSLHSYVLYIVVVRVIIHQGYCNCGRVHCI